MNSDPVTATDAAASAGWVAALLQAGDSFYPTGSFAHSGGLEGLVQLDFVRDRAGLEAFLLHGLRPALRQVELPLVAHAFSALDPAAPDWSRLQRLSHLALAVRSSSEARFAARSVGRQRLELAARLRPDPVARLVLSRMKAEVWPASPALAAAVEGRSCGAPIGAVLAGQAYAATAALLSAAMKLLRIGQNAAQAVLAQEMACLPALVAEALAVPEDEIGSSNPWLDIASARHPFSDRRLFTT